MLGAHLDSWPAATGATDNAAGVSAMMEAVRILKAIGIQPRRTIRIALWSGEKLANLLCTLSTWRGARRHILGKLCLPGSKIFPQNKSTA